MKENFKNAYYNLKKPFTSPVYQDVRNLGADSGFKGMQIGSVLGTGLGLIGGLTDFGVDLFHGDFNPGDLVKDPLIAGAVGTGLGGLLGAGYGSMIRSTGNEKYDEKLNTKRKLMAQRFGRAFTNTTLSPTWSLLKSSYGYTHSGISNLSNKIKNKFNKSKGD